VVAARGRDRDGELMRRSGALLIPGVVLGAGLAWAQPKTAPTGTIAPTASVTAAPTTVTAAVVAANLDATYGPSSTFDADFEQTYKAKAFDKTKKSAGHVTIEKPDKMLWTYSNPKGDVTVSDGTTIRVYDAATNTVMQGPVSKSMLPNAFAFLGGKGQLAKTHTLSLLPDAVCKYPGGYCLIAKPITPTNAYNVISMKVEAGSWTVRRVTIGDAQGNTNMFEFKGKQGLGTKVSPTTFQWKPPSTATVKPFP
jgi:outer membrane lipoprotein carrier protein